MSEDIKNEQVKAISEFALQKFSDMDFDAVLIFNDRNSDIAGCIGMLGGGKSMIRMLLMLDKERERLRQKWAENTGDEGCKLLDEMMSQIGSETIEKTERFGNEK